jgi:methylated-DNA-protein-cysteine methyltransferase-like protein
MTEASSYDRIYAVVGRIPRGRVATYGQIAMQAGLPGQARQVGYALHAYRAARPLPWQRVIRSDGGISPRSTPGEDCLQRELLRAEGIRLNEAGRVDLRRFQWRPRPG